MKRGFLVGINAYPSAPLKGCLNDMIDWEQLLFDEEAFVVKLACDSNATKAAILYGGRWLRSDCRAGDELVFAMSSHGTRARTKNGTEDCLVPVDYDGHDVKTLITASELDEVFKGLPAGVKLTIILDACHSGDMRDFATARPENARRVTPRWMKPPAGTHPFAYRGADRAFGGWLRADESEEGLLLAACRSDQTAADSTFGLYGRANGAFTRSLIDSLRLGQARTWLQVMEDARGLLAAEGFSQEPQLVGPARLINGYPFNGRM